MIFLKLCQCLNLTLPLACWQMAQMTQITQMCASDRNCALVCAGVRRWAWVCTGVRVYTSVCCCAQLYLGVSKCAQVCMCVCGCVWDEFSEYLLETRFLTSANYSTHPLRIFSYLHFKPHYLDIREKYHNFPLWLRKMNVYQCYQHTSTCNHFKVSRKTSQKVWGVCLSLLCPFQLAFLIR